MSHTQFKDTTVLVSEFQYLKSRPHYVRGIKCGTQIGFRPDTTQRPRTFYRLYLFTRVRGYATTVGREQYRLWKVRGAARRELAPTEGRPNWHHIESQT